MPFIVQIKILLQTKTKGIILHLSQITSTTPNNKKKQINGCDGAMIASVWVFMIYARELMELINYNKAGFISAIFSFIVGLTILVKSLGLTYAIKSPIVLF